MTWKSKKSAAEFVAAVAQMEGWTDFACAERAYCLRLARERLTRAWPAARAIGVQSNLGRLAYRMGVNVGWINTATTEPVEFDHVVEHVAVVMAEPGARASYKDAEGMVHDLFKQSEVFARYADTQLETMVAQAAAKCDPMLLRALAGWSHQLRDRTEAQQYAQWSERVGRHVHPCANVAHFVHVWASGLATWLDGSPREGRHQPAAFTSGEWVGSPHPVDALARAVSESCRQVAKQVVADAQAVSETVTLCVFPRQVFVCDPSEEGWYAYEKDDNDEDDEDEVRVLSRYEVVNVLAVTLCEHMACLRDDIGGVEHVTRTLPDLLYDGVVSAQMSVDALDAVVATAEALVGMMDLWARPGPERQVMLRIGRIARLFANMVQVATRAQEISE